MPKKVAVLGGVGKMCSSASIDLSRTSTFDTIVIADADMDRVKTLRAMLKDPRMFCQRFDAANVESIVNVIKECDIVIDGLLGCYSPNAKEAAMRANVKVVVSVNPPTLNGKLDSASWKESDQKYRQMGIGAVMSGGQPIIESLALMGALTLSIALWIFVDIVK